MGNVIAINSNSDSNKKGVSHDIIRWGVIDALFVDEEIAFRGFSSDGVRGVCSDSKLYRVRVSPTSVDTVVDMSPITSDHKQRITMVRKLAREAKKFNLTFDVGATLTIRIKSKKDENRLKSFMPVITSKKMMRTANACGMLYRMMEV